MRTLSQGFIDKQNAETNKPIRLYIVESGSLGSTVLRYAEYPTDVVYNSATYYAAPVVSDPVTENMNQEIDQLNITLGPVDQSIIYYLENYQGLKKCKVTRRKVWADALDDPLAFTDDIFYVASCALTSNAAAFSLKSKLDLMGVELPLRRFYRSTCQWKFKKAGECEAVTAVTICNHDLDSCIAIGNRVRFGAFPGTGAAIRRVYI